MWHLGTLLSSGVGSVRVMLGLDDLKDLCHPTQFCDIYDVSFHEVKNSTFSTVKNKELFSLEGTSGDHLVQPTAQGHSKSLSVRK